MDYVSDSQLRDIIRRYYLDILKREPDPGGIEFYLIKIKNKEIPLEAIPDIFKNSPEFLNLQEKTGGIESRNHNQTSHSLVENNVTKKVIDGHTLYFDPHDKILLETFSQDKYEQATTNAIKKLVKRGMNVINIGANIGYFTLLIARQVGPEGKVISFEPSVDTAKFLQRNVDTNGCKNVEVHVKAVSNKSGTSDFWVGGSSTHSFVSELKTQSYPQLSKVHVETTTIDDFLKNRDFRIDFIMMDAEGSEKYILEGMQRTLENNPDLEIITEYNQYTLRLAETDGRSFLDLIEKLGLSIFLIDEKDEKLKPVSKEQILEKIVSPNLANLLLTRKRDLVTS
ncbi:MAG: FkbM family methyltransferase [Nitrososphaeraceae archaeon]